MRGKKWSVINIPSWHTYRLWTAYTKSRDTHPHPTRTASGRETHTHTQNRLPISQMTSVSSLLLYITPYPLCWIVCSYETVFSLGLFKPFCFIKLVTSIYVQDCPLKSHIIIETFFFFLIITSSLSYYLDCINCPSLWLWL